MANTLGDRVPEMYRDITNGFWAVVIMVVAVFPLSLFKEVSAIRYICAAGVLVSLYISVVLSVEPFVGPIGDRLEENFDALAWFKFEGILKTFPVTIFCFFCQTNSQDVFYELQRPTRVRMEKVISKSTYFAIFVYFTVGAFGYLTFASDPRQLTEGMQAAIIIIADYGGRFEVTIVSFLKDATAARHFADRGAALLDQTHQGQFFRTAGLRPE